MTASLPVLLVSLAPVLPLAAGLWLLLGRLRGLGGGRLEREGAAGALLGSAALLGAGLFLQRPIQARSFLLPLWSEPAAAQLGGVLLDPLSVLWLAVALWLAAWLLLAPNRSQENPTAARLEFAAGLLLAGSVSCAALTANCWLQWGALAAGGWLLCLQLALGRNSDSSLSPDPISPSDHPLHRGEGRGEGSKTCCPAGLIWLAAADLLWLLGLLKLQALIPSANLAVLADAAAWPPLSADAAAFASVAALCLVVSLLIRCGLYPLLTWTSAVSVSSRQAAWIICFGLGPGVLLLFRWAGVLTAFPETRLMLSGLGALSALLLGSMAWGGTSSGRQLIWIASAQLGLVCAGLGADPRQAAAFQTLGASSVALFTLFALGRSGWETQPTAGPRAARALLLIACLLASGLAGQEFVWEALGRAPGLEGGAPRALLGFSLAGFAGAALALFRLTFTRTINEPTATPQDADATPLRPASWMLFPPAGLATLPAIAAAPWLLGDAPALRIPIPLLTAVLGLIALIAARTWPAVSARSRLAPLVRLAGEQFYAPALLGVLILAPLRLLVAGCQALDRYVLSPALQTGPIQLWQNLAEMADVAEDEGGEPAALRSLALAALVLLVSLWLAAVK